jgi:ornithine--oxo-acid transaminase
MEASFEKLACPQTLELIDRERKLRANNYSPPNVILARADGVWYWDIEGNRYMDCMAGYSAVNQGHNNPKIKKAHLEQIDTGLTHCSQAFWNNKTLSLLEKLHEIFGKDKFIPMNTGGEATETAYKLVRKWGEKVKGVKKNSSEIITCIGNFHGRSISSISASSNKQYRDGFGPHTPGFIQIPFGDAKSLEKAISPNTVAFIVEPIQAEGGIIVPPEGYLKDCFEICQKNRVLFAADEIQTGLGRTGRMLACDYESVDPDLLILGKSLGGGFYDVSGVLTNNEVMGVIKPGDHGSTFAGNPLAAATARAALEVIVEQRLPQRAAMLGSYFKSRLNEIESNHIKEIRGKGLLLGIEIKDSSGPAGRFCEALVREGVLSNSTHGSVIRLTPPLIIGTDEIDFATEKLARVLK